MATIDGQFRDGYSQQGLQPSVGGVQPVRNAQVQYKNDPSKRRGGKGQAGAAAVQAGGATVQYTGKAAKTAGKGMMRAGAALSSTGIGAVAGVPLAAAGAATTAAGTGAEAAGRTVRRTAKAAKRSARNKRFSLRKARTAKKLATGAATTVSIWSWGLWAWAWIQVPFAILSALMFALSQAIHKFIESLDPPSEEERTFVGELGTTVLSVFQWVAGKVLDVFGIDPSLFSPASWGVMFLYIIIAVGWMTLLTAAVLYIIRGLRPFSGERADIKIGMFLVAVLGYAIPLMNLVPWFILWTMVVMRFPK